MSTSTLQYLLEQDRKLAQMIDDAKRRREPYGHLQRRRILVVSQRIKAETRAERMHRKPEGGQILLFG